MNPEILKFFASYIEQELGIVFADHNSFQLESRLAEIAKSLLLPSVEALYERAKLGIDSSLKQFLLDVATNNETSFFRDPQVFRLIENVILPELEKNGRTEKILFWSCACSFGQEPYTLSILQEERKARALAPVPDLEIVATDVSDRALEKARSGRYSQLEVQRGLPFALLPKYFTKDAENYWTCNDAVRSRVRFLPHNLKRSFGETRKFDVILCRNVLIYQRPEAKAKIVAELATHIAPHGYIFLGAGESLIGISNEFETTLSKDVVVYRKKA